MPILDDAAFQESLVSLLIKDRQFLRAHSHLLSQADFKPRKGDPASKNLWLASTFALEHWKKYKKPIGDLIRSAAVKHAKLSRLSDSKRKALVGFVNDLNRRKNRNVEAIADKLLEFKREASVAEALQQLVDAQAEGLLTADKFKEVSDSILRVADNDLTATDFLDGLQDRILRRATKSDKRYPAIFIDPLDLQIRVLARGMLGLVMGPYKSGKSLLLMHFAIAYVIQRLNVLYITLEDPKEEVEDRMDANVTQIPIGDINTKVRRLSKRFNRFRRIIRSGLRIVDGTGEGITVDQIEQIWMREREKGFTADAIIVDYDDELVPSKAHKERRMEFADIYRGLRKLAARLNVLVWTAAQTVKGTKDKKVITGDDVAEDISKLRKVAVCLSIGKGEWGDESIFLNVAAHKNDRGNIGCNLISDKSRMLIYDRAATLKRMKSEMAARKKLKKKKTA